MPIWKLFRSGDIAVSFDGLQQRILDLPYDGNNYDSDEVVKLNKVSIRYDDRTILKEPTGQCAVVKNGH